MNFADEILVLKLEISTMKPLRAYTLAAKCLDLAEMILKELKCWKPS